MIIKVRSNVPQRKTTSPQVANQLDCALLGRVLLEGVAVVADTPTERSILRCAETERAFLRKCRCRQSRCRHVFGMNEPVAILAKRNSLGAAMRLRHNVVIVYDAR